MRAPILSALVLSFGFAPAWAQVTPDALLAEWQTTFSEADQALEFDTRSDTADGIVLTEVTTAIPVQGGKMRLTAPTVTLTQLPDDSVRIDMPDPVRFVLETGDQMLAGRVLQDGLDLIASGDAETRRYAYRAARTEMTVDAATDEDGDPLDLTLSAVLEDAVSDYVASDGGLQSTYTLGALQIDLGGSAQPDEEPGTFALTYRLVDVQGDSTGPSGLLLQSVDPMGVLTSGGRTAGTVIHGGSGYTIEISGPDGNAVIDGSSAGGALGLTLAAEGLSYDVAARDVKWRFAGDQLPFPLDLAFDGVGLDVRTPVLPDDAPQPFGARLSLQGLTLGQTVWGLFDPNEVLPRDPGEIVLDLSGMQIVSASPLSDPSDMTDMPVELTAFDLNEVLVSAVGALLTGEGSFQLNPDQTGLFPGAPGAVGQATFRLNGANKLIERLVQIGILQPQDTMGLRMMLGMAARPGPEPDSLVSTIELTPDGSIIANGMQLR